MLIKDLLYAILYSGAPVTEEKIYFGSKSTSRGEVWVPEAIDENFNEVINVPDDFATAGITHIYDISIGAGGYAIAYPSKFGALKHLY